MGIVDSNPNKKDEIFDSRSVQETKSKKHLRAKNKVNEMESPSFVSATKYSKKTQFNIIHTMSYIKDQIIQKHWILKMDSPEGETPRQKRLIFQYISTY